MKIILYGGDSRQITLKDLLEEKGYEVEIFTKSDQIKMRLNPSDIAILPLPTTTDGKILNNKLSSDILTLESVKKQTENNLVLSGNYSLNEQTILYGNLEEFAIPNAVLTAEGAIALAIINTPDSIFKSNCLVVGNGRIGKALSWRLKNLGAKVLVSARKEADFANIESLGMEYIETAEIEKTIEKFDIIFNTVNAPVIDKKVIDKMNRKQLIIELASMPGGIDKKTAKDRKINIIYGKSLPAVYSPNSAAEILGKTVVKLIEKHKKGDIYE